MNRIIFILIMAAVFTSAAFPQKKQGNIKMTINITSNAFSEGEMIPSKYTCDGADISPQLKWNGVPADAKSIALLVDDPDAPAGDWVHWVLYNIPNDVSELGENVKSLPAGTLAGITDFRKNSYGGPCPPSGTHRYFFKIYALDTKLSLKPGANKSALLDAMKGHILAQGQLMGRYKRQK